MSESNGMVSREQWEQTTVHKASRYSCGKCGERFDSPEAVYEHLDTDHAEEASWPSK